jgi:hypothetical protein
MDHIRAEPVPPLEGNGLTSTPIGVGTQYLVDPEETVFLDVYVLCPSPDEEAEIVFTVQEEYQGGVNSEIPILERHVQVVFSCEDAPPPDGEPALSNTGETAPNLDVYSVIDGDGNPVEGAEVTVESLDDPGETAAGTTGPSGLVLLPRTPEGRVKVTATAPGLTRAEFAAERDAVGLYVNPPITLYDLSTRTPETLPLDPDTGETTAASVAPSTGPYLDIPEGTLVTVAGQTPPGGEAEWYVFEVDPVHLPVPPLPEGDVVVDTVVVAPYDLEIDTGLNPLGPGGVDLVVPNDDGILGGSSLFLMQYDLEDLRWENRGSVLVDGADLVADQTVTGGGVYAITGSFDLGGSSDVTFTLTDEEGTPLSTIPFVTSEGVRGVTDESGSATVRMGPVASRSRSGWNPLICFSTMAWPVNPKLLFEFHPDLAELNEGAPTVLADPIVVPDLAPRSVIVAETYDSFAPVEVTELTVRVDEMSVPSVRIEESRATVVDAPPGAGTVRGTFPGESEAREVTFDTEPYTYTWVVLQRVKGTGETDFDLYAVLEDDLDLDTEMWAANGARFEVADSTGQVLSGILNLAGECRVEGVTPPLDWITLRLPVASPDADSSLNVVVHDPAIEDGSVGAWIPGFVPGLTGLTSQLLEIQGTVTDPPADGSPQVVFQDSETGRNLQTASVGGGGSYFAYLPDEPDRSMDAAYVNLGPDGATREVEIHTGLTFGVETLDLDDLEARGEFTRELGVTTNLPASAFFDATAKQEVTGGALFGFRVFGFTPPSFPDPRSFTVTVPTGAELGVLDETGRSSLQVTGEARPFGGPVTRYSAQIPFDLVESGPDQLEFQFRESPFELVRRIEGFSLRVDPNDVPAGTPVVCTVETDVGEFTHFFETAGEETVVDLPPKTTRPGELVLGRVRVAVGNVGLPLKATLGIPHHRQFWGVYRDLDNEVAAVRQAIEVRRLQEAATEARLALIADSLTRRESETERVARMLGILEPESSGGTGEEAITLTEQEFPSEE